jgi:hypothetical protein
MAEGIRHCIHPAADFILAFTPGHRFGRDEWQYEMEVTPIAELCLPTGKVVAADPGNLDQRVEGYFHREVPPGRYPVDIAIRHTGRIGEPSKFADTACMRVRFRDAPVTDWVIATTRDQDPEALPPFQIYGYGVDVGMGSFADSAGLVAVLQRYKQQEKSLSDEFYFERVLPAYEASTRGTADILLDPATGANLVVCSSGQGDGFYASYWGLSERGEPVCLVTDFGLLTHHAQATREVGSVAGLLGRPLRLELPGGEVALRVQMPDSRALVVETSGEGASTAEFEVQHGGERVRAAGGTSSYGQGRRIVKTRFGEPIPDQAVLVVSYLDHIEPL